MQIPEVFLPACAETRKSIRDNITFTTTCLPELCVVGGALLDRPCMVFHRMGVFCLCFCTMSSGKSLQLLCIFPFGMVCLSAISMMLVKILLAACILVGMVV